MDSISDNSVSKTPFINNKNIIQHKRYDKITQHNDEENTIYIFKSFLNEKDLLNLQTILLDVLTGDDNVDHNKHKMHYNHSSIGWHPYFFPHWSFDLTHTHFFSSYMMDIIRGLYDWTHNLQAIRIYCSVQTSTQSGNWHFDDTRPGYYTFCLYVNYNSKLTQYNENFEVYKKHFKTIQNIQNTTHNIKDLNFIDNVNNNDNDGYFHIKIPNQPIRFIRTNTNSGVLFNSKVMHLGDSPKYHSTITRCVVAFKLFLPNYTQNNKQS
jgi:hypothetical protein